MNLLGPYKYLIYALMIASALAGAAFAVHSYNEHQQKIGEDRIYAKWGAATIAAQAAQREREINLQKEKDDAITQGLEDSRKAVVDRDNALAAKRMSDAALKSISARLATATIAAARNYATTCNAVLSECTERYRAVAEDADRLSNDSLMLQRAWPKK